MLTLEEMIRRSAVRPEESRIARAFAEFSNFIHQSWYDSAPVELPIGKEGRVEYFMKAGDGGQVPYVKFTRAQLLDIIREQLTPEYVARAQDQAVHDFFRKVQALKLD